VISKVAVSFWKRFADLPMEVQQLARKSYELWIANPQHPSLRFKRFKRDDWSVRVGKHYRAVGYFRDSDTFVWTWIGTREEYNNL
jgi:hypothetical protein